MGIYVLRSGEGQSSGKSRRKRQIYETEPWVVFLAWSSRHPFHFRVRTQGSEGLNCSRPGTSSGHPIRVARTQGDHSGHVGRGQQNLSSDWDGGAVQRPLNKRNCTPAAEPICPPGHTCLGPTDWEGPGHRAAPCWHFSFSVTSRSHLLPCGSWRNPTQH